MSTGAREVDLAGEEQWWCSANLRYEFHGTTLDGRRRVQAVHGAVVEDVEGQKEGEEDDREEGSGHLRSGYAYHQDAVRSIALGRPHGRAGHPPANTFERVAISNPSNHLVTSAELSFWNDMMCHCKQCYR